VEPVGITKRDSDRLKKWIKAKSAARFVLLRFENQASLFCTLHKTCCLDHLVEPVGIEPTSKQGTKMLSTRLAVF